MRAATDEDALYELELRLVRTARSAGPLRAALARVAARLVETQAWTSLGYARLCDYAAERAGVAPRTLQDLAHVGRRLERCPVLEEVLREGTLTWAKVRLLARVEPAERWIPFARRVSAHELARAVRRALPDLLEVDELEEPGPVKPVEIACTREVYGKWEAALRVARQVAGAALSPAQCAEQIAAEVFSTLPLAEGQTTPPADPADNAVPFLPEPEAEPLAPDPRIAAATRDLGDADAVELDARLRRLLARERRLDAVVGPLLAAIRRTPASRLLGYATLEDYARERLGMDATRARALVRIEQVARRCRELRRAYRAGTLSLVQAQALTPVLVTDVDGRFAARWVRWAARVTVRRLRDDVASAMAMLQTDPQTWRATGGLPADESSADREICAPPVAVATTEDDREERCRVRLWAPPEVERFFRAVHASVVVHLERTTGRFPTAGEALGAMCDHVLEAWTAGVEPRTTRRSVFARDGWRCAVPGCTSMRNLHEHHVVFRSRGGSNAPDNRITLCAFHHLRGVHQRQIRITGSASHGLRYQLPLEGFASGDRRLGHSVASIA